MKFKIEKSAIMDGLHKVQSIVNPRPTIPVLANIHIAVDGDTLSLSTTDLEVSVRANAQVITLEEGEITLPAKRIFSIFRELPNSEIEVNVDDLSIAAIQCGSSYFKVVGMPAEEFPPLPSFEGDMSYTVDEGIFKEMLQKTSYATSHDETRPILNGALLSFRDEKLTIVATDGRRLALVEQEVEFPDGESRDIIVPTKTVNELLRTLGEKGELRIQATDKQVAFEFADMLIISKQISGTFPNFRQVIPTQCEQRIAIEREGLQTAVKRVSLIGNDQSTVKMTFGENTLEISTEAPDVGEARETMPIKYDGPSINVSFNPEFLLDPLKNLTSDEIYMELTDELSPGVVKSDVPFLYVIMPMRLN